MGLNLVPSGSDGPPASTRAGFVAAHSASINWACPTTPSKRAFGIIFSKRVKGGIMTEEQAKLVGRTFRHFKGNLYRLEGFAKDSETLEEMVVYRALYGEGGLWVRPAKMFFETIERNGRTMKRFEPVEDEQ